MKSEACVPAYEYPSGPPSNQWSFLSENLIFMRTRKLYINDDVTYFLNGRPSAPNGEKAFRCPLAYAAVFSSCAFTCSRVVHENDNGELGSRVRIEESTLNPANLPSAGSMTSRNDSPDMFKSDREHGCCARNLENT